MFDDVLTELSGVWWPAEEPDQRLSGTLSYDLKDGATLEAIETQSDLSLLDRRPSRYNLIYGLTVSEEPVSLIDCYDVASSGGINIRSRTIRAQHVAVGEHLSQATDAPPKFPHMTASWPALRSWFAQPGLRVETSSSPTRKVGLSYSELPTIELPLATGLKLHIRFGLSSHPVGGVYDLHLSEVVSLAAHPAQPEPLNYYLTLFDQLRTFFSIALYTYCSWEYLTYFEDDNTASNADDAVRSIRFGKIYSRSYYGGISIEATPPMHHFIPYYEIKDQLSVILGNWLSLSTSLGPVLSLYIISRFKTDLYIDAQFLSLAQACEVAHRRIKDGYLMDPKTFASDVLPALRQAIPNTVDAEVMKILNGKFGHFNEVSLRQRLNELVADLDTAMTNPVPDSGDRIARIVKTRNYYTHYASSSHSRPDPHEVYDDASFLRVLLELTLMRQTGVSLELLKLKATDHAVCGSLLRGMPWIRR